MIYAHYYKSQTSCATLQCTIFVCTIDIVRFDLHYNFVLTFLGMILNDKFCMYYWTHYNQQIITIFAFKCTMGIVNFLCAIAIDNFCLH